MALLYFTPSGASTTHARWRELQADDQSGPPASHSGDTWEARLSWVGLAFPCERPPMLWLVCVWIVNRSPDGTVTSRKELEKLASWHHTRAEAVQALQTQVEWLAAWDGTPPAPEGGDHE